MKMRSSVLVQVSKKNFEKFIRHALSSDYIIRETDKTDDYCGYWIDGHNGKSVPIAEMADGRYFLRPLDFARYDD